MKSTQLETENCNYLDTCSAEAIARDILKQGCWRHPDPSIGVLRPHSVSISAFLLSNFFVIAVAMGVVGVHRNLRIKAEDQLSVALSGAAARQSQADMISATLQQQVAKESACEIRTLNYRKALIEANDAAQAHARMDPYAASVSRVLAHLKALLN